MICLLFKKACHMILLYIYSANAVLAELMGRIQLFYIQCISSDVSVRMNKIHLLSGNLDMFYTYTLV